MAIYPLRMRPGGIIPPALDIGVTLRKEPPVVRPEDCPPCPEVEPSAVVRLPAGADMWADAPEIPFEEFHDAVSEYTYNKDFTTEALEPDGGGENFKTAWWKLFVPYGTLAYLTVDTQLTFGAEVDTHLDVYWLSDGGSSAADLTMIAGHEDIGSDIDRFGNGYYSRLDNVALNGNESGDAGDGPNDGTWFYIRIRDYSEDRDPSAYVLRASLTEAIPQSTPEDGHDPSE